MGNVFVCTHCGYVHRLDDWYIRLLLKQGVLSKHKCPICYRTDGFVKVISTRSVEDIYAKMRRQGKDPELWLKMLSHMEKHKFDRVGKLKKKYREAINELKEMDYRKQLIAAKSVGLIPKELREE